MKKIKYWLFSLSALLLTSCASMPAVEVSPKNPFRILPFVRGVATATIDTPDGPVSDYSWMYHLTALIAIGFAVATSWLAGHITKASKTVIAVGAGISLWALIMPAIARSANMYAPWVVGAIAIIGIGELGLRAYQRFKNFSKQSFRKK